LRCGRKSIESDVDRQDQSTLFRRREQCRPKAEHFLLGPGIRREDEGGAGNTSGPVWTGRINSLGFGAGFAVGVAVSGYAAQIRPTTLAAFLIKYIERYTLVIVYQLQHISGDDMRKTEQVNIRIEPEVKNAAEAVFRKLGLTPSQAIKMFYRQAALQQGLPFTVNIPNRETLGAMRELEEGKDTRRFDRFEDYMDELGL
jgi:DNA-damage-inducible protein J